MTERSKGERVWVAMGKNGNRRLNSVRHQKKQVAWDLADHYGKEWAATGITIRRATLIVDPVKPKRRAK
jgi:hypothetical protein